MANQNALDLIGQRFGRLVVIALSPQRVRGRRRWECQCDCGTVCTVRGAHLRSGRVASCGCAKGGTHRGSYSAEYRAWVNMRHKPLQRPVPERWDRFENFIADVGPRPSPKHRLDVRNSTWAFAAPHRSPHRP